MNFSECFCVTGCRLNMACYVGHSFRDLFLKYPITPQEFAPIRLNHIISGRRLENIPQVMYYTNIAITELSELIFWRHLQYEMVAKHTWRKGRGWGGLTEDGWGQRWGPWETMSLWQIQNIVGKGLLMRINSGGKSSPNKIRYATTEAVIAKYLQGDIPDALRKSYYMLSVVQLVFLILTPID